MAANPITDFDLGPLTWVKTEIDHSLNQARESLDKLGANASDRAPVKYILTHLHQATGALAMVGLGAATRYNEELEKLVAFLEGEDEARLVAAIAVAKKAIATLSSYLDALIAGQPDRPMRLVAAYVGINRARGATDATEADLFYPNLAASLPPVPGGPVLDDAVLVKALAHQRSQYQQGLLRVLKGTDAADALRHMHAAVCAIESLQLATANRPFWTAASAFFDALVFGGLELAPASRPLFARIDQQVKHLMDGSGKVAERLFRDVLLQVGHARAVSERITLMKSVYHLEALLAAPVLVPGADDEKLGTLLRELRELTVQQKDLWLKYTSGNRAALEPFAKQAIAIRERAASLPRQDIPAVFARLADVAPALKAKAIPPSEAQALEVATALLFIESALENYLNLGPDFARQAQVVANRVRGVMAREALDPVDTIAGGLLDEMTRRAQEKLLVFQVGQEVQVNLQNIEQVLDGFFRDATRRGEVAPLLGQFSQVQGALMIMELMDAAALNAAVMGRVQQFAEGSADGTGEAADFVADGLSALGLYINALQQGAANPREVLLPALRRFGLAGADAEPADTEVNRTGTVSPQDIEVQKQKVQALYEDWKDEPAPETREKLERAVGELQRDAAVVSDAASERHSEEALQAIKQHEDPDATGVYRAIQELAPEKAPQTPTLQVVQLVDAPGAQIDAELLGIFLEEAAEVVETIGANLEVCRGARMDREALTTIRRGFHTLKGSGRMVGLDDLGEMAWQCEQVLNKWLKDEKPATDTLLDFVELARAAFAEWVGQLREGRRLTVDGSEIARRAELLKSDQPVESAAAARAPAPEWPPVEFAPVEAEVSGSPDVEGEPVEVDTAPLETALELPLAEAPEGDATPAPAQPEFTLESLDLAAAAEASQPEAQPLPAESLDFADPLAAPEAPETAAGQFDLNFTLEPAPAEPALIEEGEVIVGGVSVPTALFAIYMGEAEEHAAAMDREMAALEADPMVPVSPAFMRAAHTLASSSRTTGFESIAAVSAALEKWLADAMEFPPEFNSHRLAVTRNAVDALVAMVQSVRGNAMPYPREDMIEALMGLRESLRLARETGEGTHINMPGFIRAALEAAAMERPADEPVAEPVRESTSAEVTQPAVAAEEAGESVPPVEEATEPLPVAETPSLVAEEAAEPVLATPTPGEPESAAPLHAEAITAVAEQPEEQKPFESGKDQRRIVDDVDRDLLPVFLDEAKEIIPLVSEGVRRWRAAPSDHAPARDLQRHLHTLKGSARMTGLMRLGELAHVLETRVDTIDGIESPPVREFEEIEERVDRFSLSLERLARGEDIVEAEPVEAPAAAVLEQQQDKPATVAVIAAAAREIAQRDVGVPEQRDARGALLRVNAEMIDRFVNEAGELSIARSRIEGEMVAFRRAMVDLTDNIGRMRTQLREVEIAAEGQMQSTMKLKEEAGATFDPLELDRFSRMQELTRFLAESLGDVITLHQGMQKNLDEAELALHAQARLNRDLQQGLMGVRLVPLGNLSDRFYRVVRQAAKELEKRANLELKGTRTELDRSVLEKITAPFEHLLRNAIAHGIETPKERAAAGKNEIGEIAVDAVQRGNEVVLTVSDDGGGLDFRRIREKAVEAGLLAPDVELPEAQLAQFIFMPGFSTATEVSQIAGRGVGMDVVRNEITSLGGRVEIASTPGRGTIFTITLPLTLAVTQAVMLRAGHAVYAIPSVMIEQVHEYKAPQYAAIVARSQVDWNGNAYPLRSLLPLLGEIDTPTPARQIPVLLLKSGLQRAAIRVDEIIGNREIVVKTIGPQLARLAGIAGATVLGNGQVVLILNPVQLVHREQPAFERLHDASVTAREGAELVVDEKSGNPLVMVVDDSLTVRKITSRMLTREGFEVATAKDGVDALQQLQDIRPDCILLDVEMPRMDGFEFARNVRADEGTKSIPIIMITSRTADKHRNRALELGVNEYMGKPYQEDQLLALIRRYTAQAAFA